ncbi:hypothetical protein FN846DRAFT_895076 [Sphaerosporella brunnea]|uniref:Uncharacterized protein n=1 Tax=Sphaerosporella brunnea TaxID=1250544 RepID=A0A5J5EIE1_9PEZI|nr:hypothetical protein FN846DRAFT_895075 [Sphaerosporella brunnea]KAA8894438.1 hypothetical protein FN846DRAFT_895076 [Sphaerosporella brunnea]
MCYSDKQFSPHNQPASPLGPENRQEKSCAWPPTPGILRPGTGSPRRSSESRVAEQSMRARRADRQNRTPLHSTPLRQFNCNCNRNCNCSQNAPPNCQLQLQCTPGELQIRVSTAPAATMVTAIHPEIDREIHLSFLLNPAPEGGPISKKLDLVAQGPLAAAAQRATTASPRVLVAEEEGTKQPWPAEEPSGSGLPITHPLISSTRNFPGGLTPFMRVWKPQLSIGKMSKGHARSRRQLLKLDMCVGGGGGGAVQG